MFPGVLAFYSGVSKDLAAKLLELVVCLLSSLTRWLLRRGNLCLLSAGWDRTPKYYFHPTSFNIRLSIYAKKTRMLNSLFLFISVIHVAEL